MRNWCDVTELPRGAAPRHRHTGGSPDGSTLVFTLRVEDTARPAPGAASSSPAGSPSTSSPVSPIKEYATLVPAYKARPLLRWRGKEDKDLEFSDFYARFY